MKTSTNEEVDDVGPFDSEESTQMTQTTSSTTEDIISGILNLVCPECGGPMGGWTKEFRRRGKCRKDWRRFWENSLTAEPALLIRTAVRLARLHSTGDRYALRCRHFSQRAKPNYGIGFPEGQFRGRG
jgi:hypothetical protein